jgi:hypothetical protein
MAVHPVNIEVKLQPGKQIYQKNFAILIASNNIADSNARMTDVRFFILYVLSSLF